MRSGMLYVVEAMRLFMISGVKSFGADMLRLRMQEHNPRQTQAIRFLASVE